MMKFTFRLISVALCAVMLFSVTASAWSTKNDDLFDDEEETFSARGASDLFFDDYTDVQSGKMPQGYAVSANGCIVTVDVAEVGKDQIKNCMILHDNRNGGSTEFIGPKVVRNFDSQSGIVAVEYRYMTEQLNSDIAPIHVQIGMDNDTAVSIMTSSGDGIIRISDKEILGANKFPYGIWFTVRAVIDIQARQMDVRLISDYFKNAPEGLPHNAEVNKKTGVYTISNIPLSDTFNGDFINNVTISTQRWEGKHYFDYLKVEKAAKRMKTNVPEFVIEAPVAENPQPVPSGRYINILYNNEYHFWSNKPFSANGRTYVPVNNFFDMLGVDFEVASGAVTAEGSITAETVEKQGVLYVPVRKIAEALGYNVSWTQETRTVVITSGEVQ